MTGSENKKHSEMSFPRNIAAITPTWLGTQLGIPIISLTAEHIGADRGMLGDVFRITYSIPNGETSTLIAKFATARTDAREAALKAGIFLREISFYRDIAPTTKSRIPECFGSWYDDETAEFLLLLENIIFDHTVDQIAGISMQEATMMMSELARLHIPADKLGDAGRSMLPFTEARRLTNQMMFIERGWPKLKSIFNDAYHWTAAELVVGLSRAHELAKEFPQVFLHGDVRADNLLFSQDRSEVVLVDWQGACTGGRVWDLAYFLVQCLTVDNRESWQKELLIRYCGEVEQDEDGVTASMLYSDLEYQLGVGAWFPFVVACSLFVVADMAEPRTMALARSMAERSLALLVKTGQLPASV